MRRYTSKRFGWQANTLVITQLHKSVLFLVILRMTGIMSGIQEELITSILPHNQYIWEIITDALVQATAMIFQFLWPHSSNLLVVPRG
jgi:hypothetical protein